MIVCLFKTDLFFNFQPGNRCRTPGRTTVIFGRLKDGGLQITSLASTNCFTYRNVFQNGVNALPKMVSYFCQTTQNFV